MNIQKERRDQGIGRLFSNPKKELLTFPLVRKDFYKKTIEGSFIYMYVYIYIYMGNQPLPKFQHIRKQLWQHTYPLIHEVLLISRKASLHLF